MTFSEWINRLFNEHKLVRRTAVFWSFILVSVVLGFTVKYSELVTEPVSDVFLGIIGLIATVLAFYQYSRDRETGYNVEKHTGRRRKPRQDYE